MYIRFPGLTPQLDSKESVPVTPSYSFTAANASRSFGRVAGLVDELGQGQAVAADDQGVYPGPTCLADDVAQVSSANSVRP